MAKQPTSVEIRAFQVGFGDCFLLSFVYDATEKRHVLIDFGTTELPAVGSSRKAAKASAHMPRVANRIKDLCGKAGLTAVVATHRHADHISGFGTDGRTGKSGTVIKDLKPKLVLQPWTEDPEAPRNAKTATKDSKRSIKGFVAGLSAMHDIAEMVYELAQRRPSWMGRELQKELSFVGMDNIKNRSAVENLIAMGAAKGTTAVWAHHGSRSGLENLLPGVKVRVLGPPSLVQSEKIRTMRKVDPDQFWHLLGKRAALRVSGATARAAANGSGRRKKGRPVPAEARWFRDHLDRERGEQLLQIVRQLDDQMNNTSLILLFEVFGKKLLFPGDAQIENWSYALQDAPDAQATRELLKDVDVYKVGHHGSLNATPRKLLWDEFTKRSKTKSNGRLRTLLSTLPGKHGKSKNKTEVPRRPLVEALQSESELTTTDKMKFGPNDELFRLVEVLP